MSQKEETKKSKQPKKNEERLPKLTEEQLQEYCELLKKELSIEWCNLHLEDEMRIMRKRTAKEQHLRLEHQRKNAK